MILGQFNKMIIYFSCALRFILLIGYASFTPNYLVKVWNNKFLKTNFSHLCSFLCFLVFFVFFFLCFFLFLDFSLDFYSLDSPWHSCFIILACFLIVNLHSFV